MIFIDGYLVVLQNHIPALPGLRGFTCPEDALRVADLMIEKIRKNEMPPSITPEEMQKLNVYELN